MNNQEKLFKAIANALNIDIRLIDENSSSERFNGWDSLGMIKLSLELEKIFKIKFEIFEITEFQNVKIIKKNLKRKSINFD